MSPNGDLPDDRLIERLGEALRMPHVTPSLNECDRLRRALAARLDQPEVRRAAASGDPVPDGRLVALAPRVNSSALSPCSAPDGATGLGSALDTLSPLVLRGERAAVVAARVELHRRLSSATRLEPELRVRARRLLGAAARRLLLSAQPEGSAH